MAQSSRIIPSDHPRAPRYKAFLVAEVAFEEKRAKTHVLNISATGALAHSSRVPPLRSPVLLIYRRIERPARVVWAHEARFGLAFDVPLSAPELEIFLSPDRE